MPTAIDSSGDIIQELAATIAEEEGVDVTDLDPIHDEIDTDALLALFANDRSQGGSPSRRLVFNYQGYDVHVHGDGEIDVYNLGP